MEMLRKPNRSSSNFVVKKTNTKLETDKKPFLGMTKRRWSENITGLLFVAPVFLWVLVFTAYPLASSLWLSFHDWNPFGTNVYIGLANYKELLHDRVFFLAYKNALVYAALGIPAGLIWGIAVALAVQNIRWKAFFRALYFLPTVTSTVAIGIFWSYNNDYGLLNGLLYLIGIKGPNWLGNTQWALPSVTAVVVWGGTGYWMVIFLANLLDIPQAYIEAAKIDGASSIQLLRYITLPLLTPAIFYYITSGLISVWTQFELVYVMTGGGPANATLMPAVHLYREAWTELRMGYASAMAWEMALIILALTIINFSFSKRWVHYGR
jgi:multiple sugar transport system permease protein